MALAVQLTPKHPPGRSSRKLREYGPQIRSLRSQGYTCEAIRLALAEVGVAVNRATVFREATRQGTDPAIRPAQPFASNLSASTASPQAAPASPPTQPAPTKLARVSGRAIAEAFSRGHIDNPLLRKDPK